MFNHNNLKLLVHSIELIYIRSVANVNLLRKLLFIILLVSTGILVKGQGNVLFYQTIQVDSFENYTLKCGYYPIVGNINNFKSKGYYSARPTQREIMRYATKEPTYVFYIISNKSGRQKAKIVFEQKQVAGETEFNFFVTKGKRSVGEIYKVDFTADINQLRAKEILQNAEDKTGKYARIKDPDDPSFWYTSFKDSSAQIIESKGRYSLNKHRDYKSAKTRNKILLIYADNTYIVLPYAAVKQELMLLIKKLNLME